MIQPELDPVESSLEEEYMSEIREPRKEEYRRTQEDLRARLLVDCAEVGARRQGLHCCPTDLGLVLGFWLVPGLRLALESRLAGRLWPELGLVLHLVLDCVRGLQLDCGRGLQLARGGLGLALGLGNSRGALGAT